jgi:hypothetical protein
VHAGFDWDYEVPAVTAWLFALGGLALARPASRKPAAGREPRLWLRALAVCAFAAAAILPAQVAVSQRALDRSAEALQRGDCERELPAARDATAALGIRPEPLQIAAICELRLGRSAAALRLIARARREDPHDWTLHYTEALIRASTGLDPRPAIREARRLDPNDPLTSRGLKALDTSSRAAWRRRGPALPLPFG